jgi:hypothetical protein
MKARWFIPAGFLFCVCLDSFWQRAWVLIPDRSAWRFNVNGRLTINKRFNIPDSN